MPVTAIAAADAAYRAGVLAKQDRTALARLAWSALMRLHHGLVYQPVWDGSPVILADWPLRRIAVPPVPELAALGLIPSAGSTVTAAQLAKEVHGALQSLELPPADREFQPAFTRFSTWYENVHFPRRNVIERLASRPIPALRSLLLQGSLSDGRIVDGYSDCDVVAVLRVPASSEEFQAQVTALLELNHDLIAYNPVNHHGPMVYFDGYLQHASEPVLPSAVLANSVLLAGEPFFVRYGESRRDALLVIDSFEDFFTSRFPGGPEKLTTAFDALWWISMAAMIPLLAHQLRTGESIWKRDILPHSPEPYVRRLTECREQLGAWIARQFEGERLWPSESNINPGLGLAHWRWKLSVDASEFGIDNWLIGEVRHAIRKASPEARPQRVTHYPQRARSEEYEQLRAHWLSIAAAAGAVESVYEFGSVGCPGLSDLDLLFVLREGAGPSPFSIANCTPRQRELMGHDPLVIPSSAVESLPFVLPFFRVRHLAGAALELPGATSIPRDIAACALTAYNFRKYPADLDAIEGNFHLTLAYLHSFTHVAQTFSTLGLPIPPSVESCIELDTEIRKAFSAVGGLHPGILQPVMDTMRQAARETLTSLESWWRSRLIWSGPPVLEWVAAYLADPNAVPFLRSPESDRLLSILEPYRAHKRSFVRELERAGLPIDGYLLDWRFLHDPAFRSRRFQFERELGGSAPALPLDFRASGNGASALLDGWSSPEDWGTWSASEQSGIVFQSTGGPVCLAARSFITSALAEQRVEVHLNGVIAGMWHFSTNEPDTFNLADVPPGPVHLTFRCSDARSPRDLGLGPDDRPLGLGLIRLSAALE